MLTDVMGAKFSSCRAYRYSLWRTWGPIVNDSQVVVFIGLNPSTADETTDDPTIRRCIGFAKRWGYGGIVMTNLFAFRATDPKAMKAAAAPVGPMNDSVLIEEADKAGLVVAAWGTHGTHNRRAEAVRSFLKGLHHLGLTKDGHPRHPLYLKGDIQPQEWK